MDAEGLLPIERELRRRLEALGPASRAELLEVLFTVSDEDLRCSDRWNSTASHARGRWPRC
jgi:hypothetical protein